MLQIVITRGQGTTCDAFRKFSVIRIIDLSICIRRFRSGIFLNSSTLLVSQKKKDFKMQKEKKLNAFI